ncbi:recombinase family protein [Frigoribacterium sp. 9N]|uniref:recombinase family protein n=1 Tax=Frigoribacterium sp. 9N TaxID=2653144 RepID=UPI00351AC9EA
MGGTPPLGYKLGRLDDGGIARPSAKGYTNTLVIHEAEAIVVRRIFDEYVQGRSFRQICAGLEQDGVRTKNGGSKWSTSSIHSVLRNATYIGFRIYGKQRKTRVPFDESDRSMGTVVKKKRFHEVEPVASPSRVYPVLIDDEVFEQAADLLETRQVRPNATRARTTRSVIPLQGLVFCEDRKMESDRIVKSGNVRFRLRGDRLAGKPMVSVPEALLEASVNRWLATAFHHRRLPAILAQLGERSPALEQEVQRLREEERGTLRARDNLLRGLEDHYDDALRASYDRKQAELRLLRARIKEAEESSVDVEDAAVILRTMSREMHRILQDASREKLRTLYERLNIRLDYRHESKTVRISLVPAGKRAAAPTARASTAIEPVMHRRKPQGSPDESGNSGWGLRTCPWRDSNPQPFP